MTQKVDLHHHHNSEVVMDLMLDETGDLKIEGGMSVVSGVSEKRQRLELALNLNLTEWFLDINRGLPYMLNVDEELEDPSIRYFFDKGLPDAASFITAELTRYLRKQDFISDIETRYEFDPRTRVYKFYPKVTTDDGEEFEIEPYIQNF